jgi:hypothetical protein
LAVTGDNLYTLDVTGSAFVLNMLVEPASSAKGSGAGDQTPIAISWTPPSGSGDEARVAFEYATSSDVNGQFVLYSNATSEWTKVASSQTMAVPRQWTLVAYEDNVFVFGDGKMVLSASAKSGGDAWSVENYLFTTATTTITFDVDGASYTQVGAGGAPLLSIIYMNGLTQPIQRHLLNLTRAEDAPGATGKLADVAAAKLFDGWGNIAVQTLQMFYPANSVASDIEMLAYRTSFLPIFDWANGRIDTTARSDLYDFYASGAGLGHVQYPQDPAYAFKYDTRYQEPAGRGDESAGPSYPLGMAASQSRIVTADYQNWNDAGLAAAVGLSGNLENDFRTSDSNNGFGPNLTVYQQKITDPLGLTQIARVAWESSSAAAADKKDQAPASLMHAQIGVSFELSGSGIDVIDERLERAGDRGIKLLVEIGLARPCGVVAHGGLRHIDEDAELGQAIPGIIFEVIEALRGLIAQIGVLADESRVEIVVEKNMVGAFPVRIIGKTPLAENVHVR